MIRKARTLLGPVVPLTRRLASATIMKPGTVRTVPFGPSRGLRYRVFEEYGRSALLGLWEPDLQRALQRYLHPGWTAFDVGANYGVHTVLMSRLVGPTGRVCAFEPVPALADSVADHIALNKCANVDVFQVALDESSGFADFATSTGTSTGHLLSSDARRTGDILRVEVATLDDLVFERGLPLPDVIKIDVEGAESRVLHGASRVLEEAHPLLIVELHRPDQDVEVGAILRRGGYAVHRLATDERITKLDSGWPDPQGISGTVVAIHTPAGSTALPGS
jgi:FkbM family methyltransferase